MLVQRASVAVRLLIQCSLKLVGGPLLSPMDPERGSAWLSDVIFSGCGADIPQKALKIHRACESPQLEGSHS